MTMSSAARGMRKALWRRSVFFLYGCVGVFFVVSFSVHLSNQIHDRWVIVHRRISYEYTGVKLLTGRITGKLVNYYNIIVLPVQGVCE